MQKTKSWPYIAVSLIFLFLMITVKPGEGIKLPSSETKKPVINIITSEQTNVFVPIGSSAVTDSPEEPFSPPSDYSEGLAYRWNDANGAYDLIGLGSCDDYEIVIPDTYEGYPVTQIALAAFAGTNISGVWIPDTVTVIGNSAFSGCTELSHVHIGEGVEEIWADAFSTCVNLTKVTMGESVRIIYSQAFLECVSLDQITLPYGLEMIDYAAFYGTGLREIHIPETVTTLGNQFVSRAQNLQTITVHKKNPVYFSSGNCIIERDTGTLIAGCSNSVIPNDGRVTAIGNYVFWGCEDLLRVEIPRSVKSIGEYAFRGCTNLDMIEYEGTRREWIAIKKGYNWYAESAIRYVRCSDGETTP